MVSKAERGYTMSSGVEGEIYQPTRTEMERVSSKVPESVSKSKFPGFGQLEREMAEGMVFKIRK